MEPAEVYSTACLLGGTGLYLIPSRFAIKGKEYGA